LPAFASPAMGLVRLIVSVDTCVIGMASLLCLFAP
jgi:hypothetical protein